MRSRVVLLVLALILLAGVPVTAGAQEDEAPTTTEAPEAPSIIPEPNSGHAPTEAGDRGGALQTGLFVAMCAGVVIIGTLVYRESRRARSERGF